MDFAEIRIICRSMILRAFLHKPSVSSLLSPQWSTARRRLHKKPQGKEKLTNNLFKAEAVKKVQELYFILKMPLKKKFFFFKLSQIWVGWMADSQTGQKKQFTLKIAIFDPNFTFCVPKSHKNPGMGKFKDLGKFFHKKGVFIFMTPLTSSCKKMG